eukprot:5343373-Prymnesium_polylepis.1
MVHSGQLETRSAFRGAVATGGKSAACRSAASRWKAKLRRSTWIRMAPLVTVVGNELLVPVFPWGPTGTLGNATSSPCATTSVPNAELEWPGR